MYTQILRFPSCASTLEYLWNYKDSLRPPLLHIQTLYTQQIEENSSILPLNCEYLLWVLVPLPTTKHPIEHRCIDLQHDMSNHNSPIVEWAYRIFPTSSSRHALGLYRRYIYAHGLAYLYLVMDTSKSIGYGFLWVGIVWVFVVWMCHWLLVPLVRGVIPLEHEGSRLYMIPFLSDLIYEVSQCWRWGLSSL